MNECFGTTAFADAPMEYNFTGTIGMLFTPASTILKVMEMPGAIEAIVDGEAVIIRAVNIGWLINMLAEPAFIIDADFSKQVTPEFGIQTSTAIFLFAADKQDIPAIIRRYS